MFFKAGGGLNYFLSPAIVSIDRFERLAGPRPDHQDAADFWDLMRIRVLYSVLTEYAEVLGNRDLKSEILEEIKGRASSLKLRYPRSPVVSGYLGLGAADLENRRASSRESPPQWAMDQRYSLSTLRELAMWWATERQQKGGDFGGGLDDDVEMWRWWAPLLIGFSDRRLTSAFRRMSSAVWRQSYMDEGFSAIEQDVEHVNEYSTDTLLPLAIIDTESPWVRQKLDLLKGLALNRWMGYNVKGQLQFRSLYLSAKGASTDPRYAFDTPYHAALLLPLYAYSWVSGKASYVADFDSWLESWLTAASGSEGGKPPGLFPAVLEWPSGRGFREGRQWDKPFDQGENEALYNWPGAGGSGYLQAILRVRGSQTGDLRYRRPYEESVKLYREHLASADLNARKIREAFGAEFNMSSGVSPAELASSGEADLPPSVLFADMVRKFWRFYTTEVRWTDRVVSYCDNYLRFIQSRVSCSNGPLYLYREITGDSGDPGRMPLPVVRWFNDGSSIAARVHTERGDVSAVEVYNFQEAGRNVLRFKVLRFPGGGASIRPARDSLGCHVKRVSKSSAIFELSLKPRASCVLSVLVKQ